MIMPAPLKLVMVRETTSSWLPERTRLSTPAPAELPFRVIGPVMVTWLRVSAGKGERREIVPQETALANTTWSRPFAIGSALTSLIASRNEPGPESFKVVTRKVGLTSVAFENWEVLPLGSVAVAVKYWPAEIGVLRVAVVVKSGKVASPLASVVTVMEPT